jgi:site-specific recombinase XerD
MDEINKDVQIILPSSSSNIQNKPVHQIKKEQKQRQYQGSSLIEEELSNKPSEMEAYIPENTRYYLNTVVHELTPILTQAQLIELVKSLCSVFNGVECVKQEHKGDPGKRNLFLLQEFIGTKRAESCSKKTIVYYKSTIEKFVSQVQKPLDEITTEDIEKYFMWGLTKDNPWTPTTQDNIRRILNTFYVWAISRRYMIYNPVSPIKPTKNKKYRVKKPFTKQDIIKMREAVEIVRDRAIIELLLSSGIRVSELVNLNIEDMNFAEKEFTVIGKGNKQRYAYFDEIAGFYMQKYLQERVDDNPALFVSINSPYERVGAGGVETRVHELGVKAGVTGKAHPHRFRHTFATNALNKGIPLEQVQQLLGHEQLDTTLIYAKVAREDVKYNHKKLMN